MATLFEQLDGVRDGESDITNDNEVYFQMQRELRRPSSTGAFKHMPPIVAMDTWFNSDEYSELMSRDE